MIFIYRIDKSSPAVPARHGIAFRLGSYQPGRHRQKKESAAALLYYRPPMDIYVRVPIFSWWNLPNKAIHIQSSYSLMFAPVIYLKYF